MLVIQTRPFPEIVTNNLMLREVHENDVNEILILRSDPRVMKYIDRQPAKNSEESMEFIKKIKKMEEDNECLTWAIVLKGETKLAGTICFWNIQKEHFRAEVGYSLLFQYHGKGIMHEAISAVIQYGFSKLNLHSIEANVNPENTPSIKLLERNNFTREAYFKENYFFDGKFLDSAIYSLIKT